MKGVTDALISGNTSIFCFPARYWIIAVCTPRVAAQNSFCAQPDTFEDTPFLDGLNSILRARRGMPAVGPNEWGQHELV